MTQSRTLYRASILHFSQHTANADKDADYFSDGALVVEGEKIVAVGHYLDIKNEHLKATEVDYSNRIIIPGLIDSHVHYPQTEMIAKYGKQLLHWLENVTFPTEQKFASYDYCEFIAKHFIQQLIKNGTTTAFAFSSVHKHASDALFAEASKFNMAIVAGKVCMDRHCPESLHDTPESAQKDSHELIESWHGNGRNLYALTPRFAPTSSNKQLALIGELAQQYPDVFVQTHLSENESEIEWVKRLFPNQTSYLDVYDHYNLVHARSLFGHCVHLQPQEWEKLHSAQATAVFCPSSNLFLGSGLFDLEQATKHNVSVTLASDVGAGTSFNMLNIYSEAYKVSQLKQHSLSALQGLYMMTQGPATAYGLEHEIGNLNAQSYADFVVLNPQGNTLSALRTEHSENPEDILFALSFIGDDRAVEATYIAGKQCKRS